MGYDVADIRIDRTVEMNVAGDDEDAVRASVTEMCERLLANPVMEDYEIEILP